MKRLTLIAAFGLLALPVVAVAQETPAPTCSTAMDVALVVPWSTWTKTMAADADPLSPGQAYTATLSASDTVTYAVPLNKPAAPGTFGGVFSFDITAAGAYSIGLDQAAWIDVAKDGAALISTAHGHGPDCSTIHKYVDFALTPGHYSLQLSNAKSQTARFMIAAKP